MPNDDFLTQFQQEPPDDFREALREQLRQMDDDTDNASTPKKPLN